MANIQLSLILFLVLNTFLLTFTQYVGNHKTVSERKAIVKGTLDLVCDYTGQDKDGKFTGWYKDGILIGAKEKDHYVIKDTKEQTKLIIHLQEADQNVRQWSVSTNKRGNQRPVECQFGQIKLTPSPQGIETDRPNEKLDSEQSTVKRVEDEAVHFKCIIKPNQIDQQVKWEFSNDGTKFTNLPDSVQNLNENGIKIAHIKKHHRGYYRCSVNDKEFTGLLRVKDPFAALWPFIGIVSTVLVLVIIILLYEKRQKAAKKRAAEEENNDNAADPLVSSSKTADNDNKKRTVKA